MNIVEFTVNPEEVMLEHVAEIQSALKAEDFLRLNAVLLSVVKDIDGNPLKGIPAMYSVKLAKRVVDCIRPGTAETNLGN